jgi:DNA-binding NarL/FixJ family response regulator
MRSGVYSVTPVGRGPVIRLVIADDHAIVREGLKRIVALANDMKVVGEAADGTEVMQRVRESDFDVLVLDLSMPGRSGIELIKLVHAEKAKLRILVLSMHPELQYAVRAIKAGANGYLTKESAPFQLLHALRRIASGGAFISAEVAEQLALGAMPGGVSATHEALSDREFEVFSLIVAGNSVTNIAARLNLSVKTISTHKTNLMHKMGLKNQSELIRYAIKNEVGDALDL